MVIEPAIDLGELGRLAEAMGVQTSYWDTQGNLHTADRDVLVAVLAALGAPLDRPDRLDELRDHVDDERVRPLEPVMVHWSGGQGVEIDLCLPADGTGTAEIRWVIATEDGRTVAGLDAFVDGVELAPRWARDRRHEVRRVALAGTESLGVGYHRLFVEVDGRGHASTIVSAPVQVAQPGDTERTWGVLAPLYALRAPGALGPHVGQLAEMGEWIDAHGGRVVATLPILATYLDQPCDFSPYTPVSQRFWNELYLDLDAVPEMAASAVARALAAEPSRSAAAGRLAAGDRFDHRAQYQLLRPVLEELARTFFAAPASVRVDFDRWLADHPSATAYAAFRAATDQTGTGWHAWGTGAARLPSGVDVHGEHARFHQYVQWTMHRQMTDVASTLSSRGQQLYLDLPVGTHGDGFDTWSDPDLFSWGCGVGAPPDDFFSEGQNWGFPPVNPRVARQQGHRHLAACLRHHMGVAGIVRLDHVMGFERLFWVPDGAAARSGAYVRYPRDELFAVLAVESSRSGCRVVGEDLGTVPDQVRDALDRHGLLGMYVSQFRLPEPGGPVPAATSRQVASIDTHDTPTFVAWVHGDDIDVRRDLGLLDDSEAEAARDTRRADLAHLLRALQHRGLTVGGEIDEHQLLVALLEELGSSPATSVLVEVDDLLGAREPQNVPGTTLDRPNWVHKLRLTIPELSVDPPIGSALDALQAARLGAYQRAVEATA